MNPVRELSTGVVAKLQPVESLRWGLFFCVHFYFKTFFTKYQ